MLERRNLLQGPNIKRIKELSFESSCSNGVRKIISTLLAGKWVDRPSNRDLSLSGNADIILDGLLSQARLLHVSPWIELL